MSNWFTRLFVCGKKKQKPDVYQKKSNIVVHVRDPSNSRFDAISPIRCLPIEHEKFEYLSDIDFSTIEDKSNIHVDKEFISNTSLLELFESKLHRRNPSHWLKAIDQSNQDLQG